MIKKLILFISCLIPLCLQAQDYSALWKGHFSYNSIVEVVKGTNKIYAASQNAVFSYDLETETIKELTTVNGLSGDDISTIYYSEADKLLLIGYASGLIEVAFDDDDDILTVVDIVDKVTIPATQKRINHFNAYGNLVYISTNYGISVFNLEGLEFGDTYYIGNDGSQVQVEQTVIKEVIKEDDKEHYIYAKCIEPNVRIKRAKLNTQNSNGFLNFEDDNDDDDVFNSDVDLDKIPTHPDYITTYTSAVEINDFYYVGTTEFGALRIAKNNPTLLEEIRPDGPLLNNPFSLQAQSDGVWVTFGEYDVYFNPDKNGAPHLRGFSTLRSSSWTNVPYSEKFKGARSLNNISINPKNPSQVFISSFFEGLLEVKNSVIIELYNEKNTGLDGLESLKLPQDSTYVSVRVGPTAFDANGLLWSLTSLINEPLKSYDPSEGAWKSYDAFTEIIDGKVTNFGDMVISADGTTKWVASLDYGLIGLKNKGSDFLIKNLMSQEDNMPDKYVRALALDKNNQLWIGTFRGLRVLYNTSGFFENDVKVDEIIISEDGVAKELLFQQFVTDIEVDGSNNKWIGTADSGVFYLSSDGQETIFHFTKNNSPLPSNAINDISLDTKNGIVYIATSKGLVSFRAGGSNTLETLEKAHIYPNPVRPNFNMVDQKVKIKGISDNINIKITDISGNLVAEAQSRSNQRYSGYNLEIDGGTAYWNGKNLANKVVASGVYLIMLSDLNTFETKVLKLMVIR